MQTRFRLLKSREETCAGAVAGAPESPSNGPAYKPFGMATQRFPWVLFKADAEPSSNRIHRRMKAGGESNSKMLKSLLYGDNLVEPITAGGIGVGKAAEHFPVEGGW